MAEMFASTALNELIAFSRHRQDWLLSVTGILPHFRGLYGAFDSPASKRLEELATLIENQSLEAVLRVHSRLCRDRARLDKAFGIGLGEVVRARAGLSDPHDGGQTVFRLCFRHGVVLFYKPRPVGLLDFWNRIVRRVLEPQFGPMGTPRLVDSGDCGWIEAVPPRPRGEIRTSMHLVKYGALLCLAYVLGASDLHAKNFIDNHDAPVLVDEETLLWSGIERPASVESVRRASFDLLLRDSVVRTGMLPRWQTAEKKEYLGGALVVRDGRRPHASHRQIEEGFAAAYDVLSTAGGADALLGEVVEADEDSVRVLLRPTRVYQRILEAGVRAHVGGGQTHRMAWLRRTLAHGFDAFRRGASGVIDLEVEALERLDIPRSTRGSLKRIGVSFEPISGIDYVRTRLASLSGNDLRRQLSLIRASFALADSSRCTD